MAEFYKDSETIENRFCGLESCLEWRLLAVWKEKKEERRLRSLVGFLARMCFC